MNKFYVGHLKSGGRQVFKATTEPTHQSHGHLYGYVTGPFRTRRAAEWAAQPNTYWTTIREAELLAALNV